MTVLSSGFMTTKQVCRRYAICSRTLNRWRDATLWENPFPEPKYYVSGGQNRYKVDDIIAWEEAGMLGNKKDQSKAA